MKKKELKKKKQTATERLTERINVLLNTQSFITWDMIDVLPYTQTGRTRLTYEGKIVFAIMEKYDLDYVRYVEKFDDKLLHGNTKGFYNGLLLKRSRKIMKIKEKVNK